MIRRRTQPLLLALPLLTAMVLAPADLYSQRVGAKGSLGSNPNQVKPFALPSQISFQHIKDAMESKAFSVNQVRRAREQLPMTSTTPQTRWVGTNETLLHQPAGSSTAERFDLRFLGVEGRKLTPFELSVRKKMFAASAGFLFRYQSFRVHDVARAKANYIIYYLGKSQRVGRPAYRIAVLPRRWDRSAWLLDLDLETAYPLYRAEYTLDAVLRAEVEVTKFLPNVRIPNSVTTWWRPTKGVTEYTTAAKALSQVVTGVRTQVVPGVTQLPHGYTLAKSQVVTDAFQGTKKAALIYSDGIDQLFVLQIPKPKLKPAPKTGADSRVKVIGDNLYVFENNGINDFYFTHGGVDFRVIGGASAGMVETAAKAIYRQAVATWK